jgi:hypothetical protein
LNNVQAKPVVDGEKRLSQSLYIIGAAVAVIGIILFVTQIWPDIGSSLRIAITLGLGLLIAAMGSMFLKQKPEQNIGAIFHLIGGMLIPGGVVVLLNELDLLSFSRWPIAEAFAIVFVFYIVLTLIHKHPVLTFFSVASGTACVYLLARAVVFDLFYGVFDDFYAYLTMLVGTSYILLSYAFRGTWNKELIRVLIFFGTVGFFSAAFSFTIDSLLWQGIYTIFIFGALILSIRLKSRVILFLSTIFLVPHIINVTREYFADSLGWPFLLVILGFIFVALGYASVSINKKFLKKS